MIHFKHFVLRILWILLLFSLTIESFSWSFFSSKKDDPDEKPSETTNNIVSEFPMEGFDSKKGMTLVENAKRKVASSNTCWQNAYQSLFAGCSKIIADEELRNRLAWHLTDCFQRDTGRSPFPYCDGKTRIVECSKRLDTESHIIYLEFYLETNTICHQLQTYALERQTELRTQQLNMNEKLDEGMIMINEYTNKLGEQMNSLRNEAVKIEKEICEVGDIMFKADDIENIPETSLDRQKQLREHQKVVIEVLQTALEESRGTLQKLIELGRTQQQELIQLKNAHDHLVQNSKTILAAQERFDSKEADINLAISALQWRVMEAFPLYAFIIFTLYMCTRTKQTYSVRSRLYIGLCLTLLIEVLVLRYGNSMEQQVLFISIIRSIFLILATYQLSYAIYIYRDMA